MNLKHPAIGMLIVFMIAIGARFAVDTYNETREVRTTERGYERTTAGPGSIPAVVAMVLPYVIAAGIGFFVLAMPPFAIVIGLVGAGVIYLGFQDVLSA